MKSYLKQYINGAWVDSIGGTRHAVINPATEQACSEIALGTAAERDFASSVKLELQADCYAGVWAAQNKDRLDPGDLEEGLTAAHAIGDDTLQQESQGRVVPDSFTHGTSAQRMAWLRKGMETGDPNQCDTFSGAL